MDNARRKLKNIQTKTSTRVIYLGLFSKMRQTFRKKQRGRKMRGKKNIIPKLLKRGRIKPKMGC